MTRRRVLGRLDTARIEAAIARAERVTALEVRVSVAGFYLGSARRLAERAFARLGMARTRGRTGVLFLIVPWLRRIEVLADQGADACVGAERWAALVQEMTARFRAGEFTEALVAAIDQLAVIVAPHLPPRPDGENELPDTVA